MNELKAIMLDLYRQLDVPGDQKGLITAELASDVVSMTEVLVSNGLSRKQALSDSLETLNVTGETAGELSLLHRNSLSSQLVMMPRWLRYVTVAAVSISVLLSIWFLGTSGGVFPATGGFIWAEGSLLAVSLILFMQGLLRYSWKRDRTGILRYASAAAFILPFFICAAVLSRTDPLLSVEWLRTSAAILSSGFTCGILIMLMFTVLVWKKAGLLAGEDRFEKTLDSILEELR